MLKLLLNFIDILLYVYIEIVAEYFIAPTNAKHIYIKTLKFLHKNI